MKILTYTIQVTVPDDADREQVTNSLNNALIYSQEAGAFWDDWNVGAVIPQGGEVTVGLTEQQQVRDRDNVAADPYGDAAMPYVVTDSKGVPIGGQTPILGRFANEQDAAEFITHLPEPESGRYNLDGPADDWTDEPGQPYSTV